REAGVRGVRWGQRRGRGRDAGGRLWVSFEWVSLADLFVDPAQRAAGVGKQLIEWLLEEMKRKRWSRLYWHTRANNYRARGLYDKFTSHNDFVRYTIYDSGS